MLAVVPAELHSASAYTPQAGDTFSYSETITVNNGQGVYTGYTDQTLVSGSEHMNSVSGSIVSASYSYSLQYSSNQGSSSTGGSQGDFAWSLENYTYTNGTDDQTGYSPPVYVWFAMNPLTPVGGTFYALNTQLTVLSKNYSFDLPSQDKYVQTIQTEGTGEYQRNDSYGVFTAKYTWYEYFDPTTGYIVGYNYVEQDNGEYQGQTGSFTYTDNLYVSSSSYPLATASAPSATSSTSTAAPTSGLSNEDVEIAVGVLLSVIIVIAVVYAVTRRKRRQRTLPEHSPMPPPPPASSSPAPWKSDVDMGSKPPEQVVIKEVAMVKCRYCGALIPSTSGTCPYCGAPAPVG